MKISKESKVTSNEIYKTTLIVNYEDDMEIEDDWNLYEQAIKKYLKEVGYREKIGKSDFTDTFSSVSISYDYITGFLLADFTIYGTRLSLALKNGLNRKLEPSKGIEEAKAEYDKLKRKVERVALFKKNSNLLIIQEGVSLATYREIERIVKNENGEYEDLMAEYESLKERDND